ncbi:hypothetical protein D9A28_05130 [Vibrio cholerae]|nr:hypothetical protein [Vibrio cholerae]
MFKKGIISLLVLCSFSALAVDGYNDIKFGDSYEKLLQSKMCTWQQMGEYRPGILQAMCSDFQFLGQPSIGVAFLIEGKVQRIGFTIVHDSNSVTALANKLKEKYGLPSSISTPQEFKEFDSTPNREIFMSFDNDTVMLKLTNDAKLNTTAMMIYSSPNYDHVLKKANEATIADSDI